MTARRLAWLAAQLSLAVLWVRFGNAAVLALAAALVLIPLVSIPVDLWLRRRLRLSIRTESNLRRGAEARVSLELENPTRLPVRLTGTLSVQNLLNGSVCREKMDLSGRCVTVSVRSSHCGRLRLTIEKARLYDCFGLIGVPVGTGAKAHITVQPDGFETAVTLVNEPGSMAESELYSQHRPGSDLTETYQLREYVPGDSPRQIHWKLSGKLDRLIVRDPGQPIVQDLLLFWERTGGTETPGSCDAQAESVVSIARALLDRDIRFRLGWNDVTENRCILHEIRELDELIAVLPRLLSAAGGDAGHAGAALLLQTRPDALCSHMVYVAQDPAPEVQDWHGYGRLTILTPDETNYPAQLAVLEL